MKTRSWRRCGSVLDKTSSKLSTPATDDGFEVELTLSVFHTSNIVKHAPHSRKSADSASYPAARTHDLPGHAGWH
eukprot:765494-Hanusia_phi.AAC.1